MTQPILAMDEVRALAGQPVHGIEASMPSTWYERQLALKVLDQHARAEAAEADVSRLRAERDGWMKASDTANAEVARLREALAEALDPNTEWTSSTWARLLAIRDGDAL